MTPGTYGFPTLLADPPAPTSGLILYYVADTLRYQTPTSGVVSLPSTVDVSSLGLENVDNTSDANKPISLATQSQIDALFAAIAVSNAAIATNFAASVQSVNGDTGAIASVAKTDESNVFTENQTINGGATQSSLDINDDSGTRLRIGYNEAVNFDPQDSGLGVAGAQVTSDRDGDIHYATRRASSSLGHRFYTSVAGVLSEVFRITTNGLDGLLKQAKNFANPTDDQDLTTKSYVDAESVVSRNRDNHTGFDPFASITEAPVTTTANAGSFFTPRVNAAGNGWEFFQLFEISAKRTDPLMNQTNVFAEYLTINANIPVTGSYMLFVTYGWSLNSATSNFEAHIAKDGDFFLINHAEPADSAGTGVNVPTTTGTTVNTGTDILATETGIVKFVGLTAGPHTFVLEFRGQFTNNEATIHTSDMLLKRLIE